MDGVIQDGTSNRLVQNSGGSETRLFTRNVADEALAGCAGKLGLREFYSLPLAKMGIGVVAETVTRLCQMAIPIEEGDREDEHGNIVWRWRTVHRTCGSGST